MVRPGGPLPPGGTGPLPLGRGLGGWTPPVVNHGWAPPGTSFAGPSTAINGGNPFAPRTDIVAGRGGNNFAGGWSGLSSAADAVSRYDFTRGTSLTGLAAAAKAVNRYDVARGMSSAADTVKGWYNREYARDALSRWPWWGGWGSGSDGAYGSSGGGYGSSGGAYGSSYATDAGTGTDGSATAASQASVTSNEDAANSEKESAAKGCMEVALRLFQNGDYAGAQRACEGALRLAPGNANVHEFRALCQFAQGQYQGAAATLYEVLAAGPGWDWNTLSSLYPSAATYSKQLRTLEEYVKQHPQDAAGRFVLAYHYLVLDERGAAAGQLQEVVKLQPRDQVSAGILKALEKAKPGQAPPAKPTPWF